MAKADLHVHSKFSDRPSEWWWQRLGAAESYTEPEFIYRTAKAQGMDWVTITDHDQIAGALQLQEAHPRDVLTGVETTAFFPEDGCKVHVLVWGLSEAEFRDTQRLRTNIYDLRDYLHEHNLAHAVAHATFAVNGRLTLSHLEKLILLFNVFEGLNGGRNRLNNETWTRILRGLTPEHLEDLYHQYRIAPVGEEPWIKGFTGGSDDHGGIFIGRTYTVADGATPTAFLRNVMQRRSCAEGRQNDYQSLAFTLYKIGYDYARAKGEERPSPILTQLTEMVFDRHAPTIAEKLRVRAFKSISKKEHKIERTCLELIHDLQVHHRAPVDEKLALVYHKAAGIVDEFVKIFCETVVHDVKKGQVVRLVRDLSSSLPAVLLSVPFLSTLKHLYQGRALLNQLEVRFSPGRPRQKRVLWFTDTLTDLNGVAITLRKVGWLAHVTGRQLQIVTSLDPNQSETNLPPNVINLPTAHAFNLPTYESYAMRIPSLLDALERLYPFEPDEVLISTPGPIGLLGLLVARLFNARSVGIYHTDFTLQAKEITGEETIANLLEAYTRWFYSSVDEIRVPTLEYRRILTARGLDPTRMKLFRRGIDAELFRPRPEGRAYLAEHFNLRRGPTLLYVGRISKDKDLDFLGQVYVRLLTRHPDLNLVITGDGPYLAELRERWRHLPRAVFTGRLAHEELPLVYSGADVFIFPSITDTFGLVVLEAQACGLPAVVSNVGGPQEIVTPHQTGYVLPARDLEAWVAQVDELLLMREARPRDYEALQVAAREMVLHHCDWDAVLRDLLGEEPGAESAEPAASPEAQKNSQWLVSPLPVAAGS